MKLYRIDKLAKPFGRSEIGDALAGLFAADDKVVRFPGRKHQPKS